MRHDANQGLEGLSLGLLTSTQRRVDFVPARFPDKAPLPQGIDVIHLNPSSQVRRRSPSTVLSLGIRRHLRDITSCTIIVS
jgi:hypothetical protein